MDGNRKHIVRLTPDCRQRMEDIARNGSAPAKKITHARVLLMSDQHHGGWCHDNQIGTALGLHINTVARIRKRFVCQGEQPALDRKPRLTPAIAPRLDGQAEAALVTICCSTPPDGRVCWTLSLLQEELVGRKIVTSISRETIRKTLKKTRCNPGASSDFVFPNATRPVSSRRWSRCWTSMPSPLQPMSR
jgi:hypothetical protein